MQKGEVMIWMQLLGFDRDDPDRGAARYLEQVGFAPDGIVALLYHPDFVHLHRGMDTEYRLFDDNAAYYGIPRNAERERQPWTNHDLRALSRALQKRGVPLYASLMGAVNHSAFHTEWIERHPEILYTGLKSWSGMNVLKRFADGSYYEDFFAEKLAQTLVDYELAGVQLCDSFCPPPGTRAYGDFSADMTRQFIDWAAPVVPAEVAASLDADDEAALTLRQAWLWRMDLRADWIRFNAWRWERFFTKVAAALHAVGKKLMVLGQYCTDPFETLYCIGVDLRRLAAAGVDSFCPNLLPTSVYMQSNFPRYFFHRYMTIAPLTAACVPDAPLYSMLGVQDATEEWDVLHHAPLRFERDLYTEQSWRLETADGSRRAMRGYLLCLGDGIRHDDWSWMRRRFDTAFSADVRRTLSPAVLWSDAAFDAMLPAYIATRRWTVHKTVYELAAAGAPIGAAVRPEALDSFSGPLLAPCFDLLPPEEQRRVAAHPGPVVCTASPGFDPAAVGVTPAFCFSDRRAAWPQTAFGWNFAAPNPAELENLLAQDDDAPDCSPEDAAEFTYTLLDTLSFRKVSAGFLAALARVVQAAAGGLFTANCPFTAYELTDGAYRVYLYNANPDQYVTAKLSCALPAASAQVVSRYPHLPVQFAAPDDRWVYDGGPSRDLRAKLAPSGVTILDVTLEHPPAHS